MAVVAAIDMDGRILSLVLNPKSIKAFSFTEFMDKVAINLNPGPAHMLVDNLRMHHSFIIKAHAKSHGINLLYNPKYSPIFNPIEGLWAYAKRIFSRHCINDTNFNDVGVIFRLVKESIEAVPAAYLRGRIRRSLIDMKSCVN